MAKYKRMCILFSERKALADSCEKWAKENGIQCSAINVIAFLDKERLLNPDLVAAFVKNDIIQVRYYPDGSIEVKAIKKNRGQPQNSIKEVK